MDDHSNRSRDNIAENHSNKAERIQIIRRTLRRQSICQPHAPLQPPAHSIMAGFAGFVNLTTATCNTGVPSERRMTIPLATDLNTTANTKEFQGKRFPCPNIGFAMGGAVSPKHQYQNSGDSTSSSTGSSGTGTSIGKLRSRWSDSNVMEAQRSIANRHSQEMGNDVILFPYHR